MTSYSRHIMQPDHIFDLPTLRHKLRTLSQYNHEGSSYSTSLGFGPEAINAIHAMAVGTKFHNGT